MSKRFTRNIINIEKIDEQGFDTNTDGDLLLTKDQQAYIRLAMSYHCLTDNVKVINGLKPDKDGNVSFKYVEKVLTESEGLTLSEDDKNNTTLTINLNEKWLADFIAEHGGSSGESLHIFTSGQAGGNFINLIMVGDDGNKEEYKASMYTTNGEIEPIINYDESSNTTYFNFNFGENPVNNSSISLMKGNQMIFGQNFVLPNLDETNQNSLTYIEGIDSLKNQLENIVNRLTALENKG